MIGFGLGVYFLNTLTAEKGLDSESITALSESGLLRGTFLWNLPGVDGLHLGDGLIMDNANRIWLDGKVAPGPGYRLYPVLKCVETGTGFQPIVAQSPQTGPIKAFENIYPIYQTV